MTHWKGKLLDDLTRVELLEALQFLAARYQEQNTDQAIHHRAVGRACSFLYRGAGR